MSIFNDLGQKLKGMSQEIKGEYEQQTGQGVKGGISKLKGKFNKTMADIKMNARNNDDY
jgi:hypothetical protein